MSEFFTEEFFNKLKGMPMSQDTETTLLQATIEQLQKENQMLEAKLIVLQDKASHAHAKSLQAEYETKVWKDVFDKVLDRMVTP